MSIKGKFITITGDMVENTGLKGNELLLYALINGFSQDSESWFYGSISYIQQWLGLNKRNTIHLLQRLVDKGYIEKKDIIDNKVKRCMYRCTLPTGGGVEKTPNIYNIDIDNIDNIYIDSDKSITEKNTLPSSTPDKASKKGTRLSENWQPNNEEIEYAKNKGLSQEEIETQCELFLNYWLAKSGSGAVKKDWKRTWFTWVLNYVNNYKRARRIAPQNRLQEVQNHNMEVLRQLHKQDNNNSQLPIRTVFDF